jgi:hypothetical protein
MNLETLGCESATLFLLIKMYKDEEISALLPDAEEFVEKNDRGLYAPLLAAIENYCSSRSVKIGNPIYIIRGKPDRTQYFIDVYAAYALTTAREIAITLAATDCPHIPSRTAAIRTVMKNEEFEIKVFDRLVCRVFSIKSAGGIDYIKLLGDCPRAGVFSQCTVQCLPPEIVLIEAYRILYSPSQFSLWSGNISVLKGLWDEVGDISANAEAAVVAHGVKVGGGGRPKELLSMLGSPIVCGDVALEKLLGKSAVKGGRLQIITSMDVDQIKKALAKFYRRKLIAIKYPVNIPIDFQLEKHTIYSDRVPILDVYNSTTYELIPYKVIDGVRVASPFVCMRFLLISMWLYRVIALRTKTPLISEGAELIAKLREYIKGVPETELFLGWKYEGSSVNPNVVKNERRAETGQFPMYYPAKEGKTAEYLKVQQS